MLRRETRKYLYDIQQACQKIQTFVRGSSLPDYNSNEMLRSAVERQLGIIGEALSQLLREEPALEAWISHARRIVGLRNRLIHGYADIANDIVWTIVEEDVPVLLNEASSLLASGE